MRICGDCTLCCKLEKISELQKPRNQWCQHCRHGCSIYADRPKSCREFRCRWLNDETIPDHMRPDLIGCYAVDSGDMVRLVLDPQWHMRTPQDLNILTGGKHAIVLDQLTVTFVPSKHLPMPEQLQLNWTL